jgi:hypothetical protein
MGVVVPTALNDTCDLPSRHFLRLLRITPQKAEGNVLFQSRARPDLAITESGKARVGPSIDLRSALGVSFCDPNGLVGFRDE